MTAARGATTYSYLRRPDLKNSSRGRKTTVSGKATCGTFASDRQVRFTGFPTSSRGSWRPIKRSQEPVPRCKTILTSWVVLAVNRRFAPSWTCLSHAESWSLTIRRDILREDARTQPALHATLRDGPLLFSQRIHAQEAYFVSAAVVSPVAEARVAPTELDRALAKATRSAAA